MCEKIKTAFTVDETAIVFSPEGRVNEIEKEQFPAADEAGESIFWPTAGLKGNLW